MTDIKELVERLRLAGQSEYLRGQGGVRMTCSEAAEALTTLASALEPFAATADNYAIRHQRECQSYIDEGHNPPPPVNDWYSVHVNLGDCRKARAALGKETLEKSPAQQVEKAG